MSYRCQICNKKAVIGSTHKHRRGVASDKFRNKAPKTSRKFRPNLQKATIEFNGVMVKVHACTSCLKLLKKRSLTEKEFGKLRVLNA